jgi:hypothetical protein
MCLRDAQCCTHASSAGAWPCIAPLPPLLHRQVRPQLLSSSPSWLAAIGLGVASRAAG